jgi:hypothetical protein
MSAEIVTASELRVRVARGGFCDSATAVEQELRSHTTIVGGTMSMAEDRDQARGRSEPRPCMFLSHSSVDEQAARELKRRILKTSDARESGLTVWFDKDDILPGRDWQEQIELAITREATAFVVYVGTKGEWVEREVRLGLSRATGNEAIPFIPVIASGSVGDLPPFARQYQGVFDPLNNRAEFEKLVRAILGTYRIKLTRPLDEPIVGPLTNDSDEGEKPTHLSQRDRPSPTAVSYDLPRLPEAYPADSGRSIGSGFWRTAALWGAPRLMMSL